MKTLRLLLARLKDERPRLYGREVVGLSLHPLVSAGILEVEDISETWACSACEERCGELVRKPYTVSLSGKASRWAVTCTDGHQEYVPSQEVAAIWRFNSDKMAEMLKSLLHCRNVITAGCGMWNLGRSEDPRVAKYDVFFAPRIASPAECSTASGLLASGRSLMLTGYVEGGSVAHDQLPRLFKIGDLLSITPLRQIVADLDIFFPPSSGNAPRANVKSSAMPPSLSDLYGNTIFDTLSDDDSKLRMGLSALSEYAKECITKKEVRMFGCPLFMRTVYEISKTKVASIRPVESEEAEGLWTDFKSKFNLALTILNKHGLEGADEMKMWLQNCGDITGQAGSYRAYRRIRHEVIDGLLSQCRNLAKRNHADCEDAIEMIYCGIYDGIGDLPSFLPISQITIQSTVLPKMTPSSPRSQFRSDTHSEAKSDGATIEGIKAIVKEQADRIIKAGNKSDGETRSLIKRTWGGEEHAADKRSSDQRCLIDKAVRLYVQRHEIDGNPNCSITWCCKQVIGRNDSGKYDEKEVKKLDNLVRYDLEHFYNIDAEKAKIMADLLSDKPK